LITKAILAMGSLLVEMAYPSENECLILMGSFAAAGPDPHPYPSPAFHLPFRRFGYRIVPFSRLPTPDSLLPTL